ncbi:hypothetical protein ADL22_07395 [Streptomyces sp. NRRL F-4489]|uniref:hypothetical protein n=1 Tax=Streptomyces sp. NRRL F-4489 TaxID=1609095 RepID=UPI000746D475|nr:hypothetical protein [Streptomyces sp. NRRL F-4489]KUL50382.1 hypothetical protein ADL22_07395 [Streptomyces sp. NRRL F-4489]
MEVAVAIFGLLFLLFVAAGVFLTVKAAQAAKRGVDRKVAQARRTVEDTTLRARQFTQPGAVGELAQLRLSLRTSMRATQEVLGTASADDPSLGEAVRLFERLSAHGRELDDDLRRLEREPDRAAIAARLPELRERLERITHSAESLRWAARDRARKFADDDLAALSDQIDMEAGALRHWTDVSTGGERPQGAEARGGAGSGHVAGAGQAAGAAGSGSAGAPGAGRASGSGGAGYSWGASADEAGEPPAITARDPRKRWPYPWEKSPQREPSRRPEGRDGIPG